MPLFRIKNYIRFYFIAFLASFFFLIFTFLAFWEVYERVEDRNRNLFEFRAENVQAAIEKRMYDYIQILKGVQGLYMVNDSVGLNQWRNYVNNLEVDVNYPGILGIGYAAFFEEAKLKEFEEYVKKTEYPDFRVWPEGERPYYSSVIFLEPLDLRNTRALGYDMYSDPVRRKAMETARDTGKPALTEMVKLVQETEIGVQKGFLLYLPVYNWKGGNPLNIEERRSSLIGFVYSPFRVDDLINGILGRQFSEIDVEIYDGPTINKASILYDRDPMQSYQPSQDNLHVLSSIQIGGHPWQVSITANPDFGYEISFPWFILGGGVLVSFLIFMIMYSVANIQKSNYLNQLITDNASPALFILDTRGYCTFMNPAAEVLSGYSFSEIQDHLLHNIFHSKYPDGTAYSIEDCPITNALKAKHSLFKHEDVFFKKSGESFYVNINTQPIYQSGKVVAHLMEVRDITQEKEAEVALKEKNRNLETLNNIGKNLSAELELKKLLQLVTDSCTELTQAEYGAFFYNQKNEKGDSIMLYTLSGAEKESFSRFHLPRKTEIFAPTFEKKTIIRADDITKDPRYGNNAPYNGMPEGHLPVKSYLSVPVISRNGETIGGLFFGHSKPGIFTINSEEIVKGIASQAAVAIDNSQLFETIHENNKELIRINNDLDNFVYTASHDLKAPVLNIEGLVNALDIVLKKNDQEKLYKIIEMIKLSVKKFKETIDSLTEVSKINKNLDAELEPVNLKEILADVKISIQDMIESSGTLIREEIECGDLIFSKPNLKSILHNLLTNSIKYRSNSRSPIIRISCKKEGGKVVLQVSDNGLGMPANQLPKIFSMFKRYHSHVEGTGVGLYLVKRIAENYGGSVEVESEVEQGTKFTIQLPEF